MANNPFNPNPMLDREQKIFNRDSEMNEASYYAESDSMFFVGGEFGIGKTFIARKIIESLKSSMRIVYIDANRFSKKNNIEKVILGAKGVFDSFNKKKGMFLVIDNVSFFPAKNLERVKYYFDQGYVNSVLFIGENISSSGLDNSILSRIGSRVIILYRVDVDIVFDIYASRNEKLSLSFQEVKEIYINQGMNLKSFIGELSLIHGSDDIFLENYSLKDNSFDVCPDCGKNLIKVNKEWRCKVCDAYCSLCGQLISDDDVECPRCLAIFN